MLTLLVGRACCCCAGPTDGVELVDGSGMADVAGLLCLGGGGVDLPFEPPDKPCEDDDDDEFDSLLLVRFSCVDAGSITVGQPLPTRYAVAVVLLLPCTELFNDLDLRGSF